MESNRTRALQLKVKLAPFLGTTVTDLRLEGFVIVGQVQFIGLVRSAGFQGQLPDMQLQVRFDDLFSLVGFTGVEARVLNPLEPPETVPDPARRIQE